MTEETKSLPDKEPVKDKGIIAAKEHFDKIGRTDDGNEMRAFALGYNQAWSYVKELQAEVEKLRAILYEIRGCTYDRDTDDEVLHRIKQVLTDNGFPYESKD
jgi:hypothetical protein